MKDLPKIEDEAEYYFIQYIFCENRDLLKREFRQLYDVLFDIYFKFYKLGRSSEVGLMDINKRFEKEITVHFIKMK